MSNSLEQEPIALRTPLIISLVLLACIGAVVFVFSKINQNRGQRVITAYDEHAQAFVSDNRGGVEDIFSLIMPACAKHATKSSEKWSQQEFECKEARTHLDQLVKSSLPNYSSVAFARFERDTVEIIEASGNYHEARSLDASYYLNTWRAAVHTDLKKYTQENMNILRWQDFSRLPMKEVITPIKKGEVTVGYILQSVLE